MISVHQRTYQAELIDGEDYDSHEYETMLSQIEKINHLSLGYAPTLKAIARVAKENPGRKLRILDVGSGHGDTLRELRKWGVANKIELELTGIDLNPRAADCAISRTPASMQIKFETGDVFKFDGRGYDVIINALMTHHLDDDQIVRLLKWMTANAQLAWFINDLHRHPIAYHFIKHATRALGYNRLIQNDAPLSVARSFSRKDWLRYLAEAGVEKRSVEIKWHFPFRFGVFCETRLANQRGDA